ncbi:OsmC family protein [Tropicimonas sp. IMCC6043]|uniref:OsmC family protein n=1 Tax=Tropicimonas sp. IMCC6043 TaxID=2510645 RepID=UPI00101C21A9|nr:OsmC family protein [Tropicimonas sp. IMCC6043]RYH11355.1 OsmC family peroxiredoxin [Tropicimonas sp. IMCC6043]
MAMRIKPKVFGPITVLYGGDGELRYRGPGEDHGAASPGGTPVDILLASVGACIAKSLKIAADQRVKPLEPFAVDVTGTKATDLPNRLGTIGIRVIGRLTDEAGLASEVIRHAKSICTVSNTLNCTFELEHDRSEEPGLSEHQERSKRASDGVGRASGA